MAIDLTHFDWTSVGAIATAVAAAATASSLLLLRAQVSANREELKRSQEQAAEHRQHLEQARHEMVHPELVLLSFTGTGSPTGSWGQTVNITNYGTGPALDVTLTYRPQAGQPDVASTSAIAADKSWATNVTMAPNSTAELTLAWKNRLGRAFEGRYRIEIDEHARIRSSRIDSGGGRLR